MNKNFLSSLIVLLSCHIFPLQSHPWYSEYWQQFLWKMWSNDSLTLSTYARMDTGNHFKHGRSIQISEQLAYQLTKNFSLESHYKYGHSRSIVANSSWQWQHRLELEANYQLQLAFQTYIKTRNRLEIRKIEDTPRIQYRLRQKTAFVIPLENAGRLNSLSIHNELFYNVSTHLFDQDRICPCQLNFAISDRVNLDLFFMIRLFLSANTWQRSAVLGTQLNF